MHTIDLRVLGSKEWIFQSHQVGGRIEKVVRATKRIYTGHDALGYSIWDASPTGACYFNRVLMSRRQPNQHHCGTSGRTVNCPPVRSPPGNDPVACLESVAVLKSLGTAFKSSILSTAGLRAATRHEKKNGRIKHSYDALTSFARMVSEIYHWIFVDCRKVLSDQLQDA